MRLVNDPEQPAPLIAGLEVAGAALFWVVTDPPDAADAVQVSLTDPARADWLWRVVGADGHLAILSAAAGTTDLPDVAIVPGSLAALRRLAIGHWLRRWWPASRRDGIPGLDAALLDVEVALLTAAAQAFFSDDTLDSDAAALLAPHAAALTAHLGTSDRRVRELVRASAELADEIGVDGSGWPELSAALDNSANAPAVPSGRQDDYALAAGSDAAPGTAAIGRGVASINWAAVPPGIFDAAEDTVEWRVAVSGPTVIAVVRAAVIGPHPATDIAVRVQSGDVAGTAALDARGGAVVALVDAQGRALLESDAWNHDWPPTSVVVGAGVSEAREIRDQIRQWVRTRLDQPPQDAFLAEILAAESTY
ncbi:hypothetical protein [Mycobacterium vicinigordonae]|uniref:Uncharacterized protein n=1 Tax=Mycobacterium vicinigordonae TaxID=1719132 RepID=A0A7D6I0M3_9MYCO|nr:hypothetical protein [Mycobacterium vicinigordonae]QLL07234.1 hypothetical protein H0P51_26830 [Mycobacterium vicinigordonae]